MFGSTAAAQAGVDLGYLFQWYADFDKYCSANRCSGSLRQEIFWVWQKG